MDTATKKEIIEKYAIHEGDTGSPEVQIAVLSYQINHLTIKNTLFCPAAYLFVEKLKDRI